MVAILGSQVRFFRSQDTEVLIVGEQHTRNGLFFERPQQYRMPSRSSSAPTFAICADPLKDRVRRGETTDTTRDDGPLAEIRGKDLQHARRMFSQPDSDSCLAHPTSRPLTIARFLH
jgi:hypothetical protein